MTENDAVDKQETEENKSGEDDCTYIICHNSAEHEYIIQMILKDIISILAADKPD